MLSRTPRAAPLAAQRAARIFSELVTPVSHICDTSVNIVVGLLEKPDSDMRVVADSLAAPGAPCAPGQGDPNIP